LSSTQVADRESPALGEPEAVYKYVDEGGVLLFEVLRFPGKRFLQRRPDGNGGWLWNLDDARRVLFHLPDLLRHLEANRREPIYVVEGERDVLAAEATGATATCNPGGAGKWRDEYSQSLQGARRVVVVADRDDSGARHARAVRESLAAVSVVAEIVQALEGKDLADHLAAGYALDDLCPVDVDELGPPTARLRFRWGPDFLAEERDPTPAVLGGGADVLIPQAGLVILGGEGGAGKSTMTLHALAHFGAGIDWLTVPVERPLRLGVIENEGPKVPYLEKLERFCDHWQGPDFLGNVAFLSDPWARFTLADEGLRAELRAFAVDQELDLVVAGPLGRLGVQGAGSPEETRAFMDLLAEVGCQRDVAFWLIHHVSKQRHGSIVQALSGDWGGHPDLILGLEPEGKSRSKLTFGKVRWGDQSRGPLILEWLPDEEGIGYRIVETGAEAEVDWQDLCDRVLTFVARNPGASQRKVEERVEGKATHIREALSRLQRDSKIDDRGSGNRKAFHALEDPVQDELEWK
jgi:AAA domain/Toprim-like